MIVTSVLQYFTHTDLPPSTPGTHTSHMIFLICTLMGFLFFPCFPYPSIETRWEKVHLCSAFPLSSADIIDPSTCIPLLIHRGCCTILWMFYFTNKGFYPMPFLHHPGHLARDREYSSSSPIMHAFLKTEISLGSLAFSRMPVRLNPKPYTVSIPAPFFTLVEWPTF